MRRKQSRLLLSREERAELERHVALLVRSLADHCGELRRLQRGPLQRLACERVRRSLLARLRHRRSSARE